MGAHIFMRNSIVSFECYIVPFLFYSISPFYTKYQRISNKYGVDYMIDKRIGKRIKERRESLGLTQEAFAEKIGVATNYISTIERGASFPRCEKLIAIINGLECSADAIFCDVIKESSTYRASILADLLVDLPAEEQDKILAMVDLMIKQAKK